MQQVNRKFVTRVAALAMALILLLSFTASLAEFSSSNAGVKYKSTYKIGTKTTSKALKKSFGKWSSRKKADACTFGYASYTYNWKSKGIKIETVEKTKGSKEEIITIILSKKTVPTIGGLKVGSKASKIGEVFGSNCTKSGSTYRYTSGSIIMTIATKKDKVTKITIMKDM